MADPLLTLMARLLVASRNHTGTRVDPHEVQLLLRTEPFGTAIRSAAAEHERLILEAQAEREAKRRKRKEVILEDLPFVREEAEKRRKRPKRAPVTVRLSRAIAEARKAGMTYKAIAEAFGVGADTARRHASEINAEKLRAHERKRHERLYNDPAYAHLLEKKRQRAREYEKKGRKLLDKSV